MPNPLEELYTRTVFTNTIQQDNTTSALRTPEQTREYSRVFRNFLSAQQENQEQNRLRGASSDNWTVYDDIDLRDIRVTAESLTMSKTKKSTDDFEYTLRKHHPVVYFNDPINQYLNTRDGYQKDKTEAFIGIEIEQESLTEFTLPKVKGWQNHNEGSLRNFGFEYVLNPPLPIKNALEETQNLFAQLQKKDSFKPLSSIRTSVHVHFDVTKYCFNDWLLFLSIYWLAEDFLSDFAGESRKGNLFCIRFKDSQFLLKEIGHLIRLKNPTNSGIFSDNNRYSSANLAALTKFGSLEFRMMRGTHNFDEIDLWVSALEEIRQYALKFKDLKEFLNYFYKEIPAEELLTKIFSKEIYERLIKYSNKSTKLLAKEIRQSILSLACIVSDVETLDFTPEILKVRESFKNEYKKILEEEEIKKAKAKAKKSMTFAYTSNEHAGNTYSDGDTDNVTSESNLNILGTIYNSGDI